MGINNVNTAKLTSRPKIGLIKALAIKVAKRTAQHECPHAIFNRFANKHGKLSPLEQWMLGRGRIIRKVS